MIANKYGNFLTIVLIIVIVGIVVGAGFIIYNNFIKPNVREKKSAEAIAEFDRNFSEVSSMTIDDTETNNEIDNNNNTQDNNITNQTINSTYSNNSTSSKKKTYYDNFVMIGYITISKTNVKLPILTEVTPKALDTAVGVLYPSNPKLNEPGNVVIVGHNYRNGKFFSNNKKLSIGDKIKIKDETGRELMYTIYNKFETTPEDTSFYARDTQGAIEITLSTCTDDSKARTIILAKVQ